MTARKQPVKKKPVRKKRSVKNGAVTRVGRIVYSEDLGRRIAEGVSDGKTLREIAALKGMPSRTTLVEWELSIRGFAVQIAHARRARADDLIKACDDEIKGLSRKGFYRDAKRARARIAGKSMILKHHQWRAQYLYPAMYGQKLRVETSVDVAPAKYDYGRLTEGERATLLALQRKARVESDD